MTCTYVRDLGLADANHAPTLFTMSPDMCRRLYKGGPSRIHKGIRPVAALLSGNHSHR